MPARIRPLLIVGLLVLQGLTVIGVVVLTGRSSEKLLVGEMRQTMRLVVGTLDERTTEHLRPAESAARLTAHLLEGGVVPVADDRAVLAYLDAQVLSSSAITGAYVGRPDGSFVLVSRDGATIEGGTRVKTVTVGPDGRTSTTVQRDARGVEQDRAVDPTDTYDPRERPWYGAAVRAGGLAWTDPYVFFASREPGITAAAPAHRPDGTVAAVVGVDLSLRDLSTFVGGMRVSPASRAVIVDVSGSMVASGDLSQVMVDDGDGGLRRATLEDVTDPVLVGGVAAARARGDKSGDDEVVVIPYEVDGRRWEMALAPLTARSSWRAAVSAPEDEFVDDVVDAQRQNALVAVGVSLLVTALAIPLVTVLGRRVDRMAADATTDPLTGLPNRRRFDQLVHDHVGRASSREPVCVAAIDVDHFKQINDTSGHAVGDEVLIAIAGRFRGALRDEDVVARVGGDEFSAILAGTPLAVALESVERARRAVCDTPVRTAGGDVHVSVTVGVAETVGEAADDVAAVLERADLALYAAKDAGRNRVAGPTGVVEAGAGA